MPKFVIYQVLPRLFGNYNTTRKYNGNIEENGCGKFNSFTEFIERIEKVDSSVMNKRAVESLIKCGAMDSLGANRAQLISIFEKTIDGIHADRKRNIEGQFSIFDTINATSILESEE